MPRILVMEYEEILRDKVVTWLNRAGYETIVLDDSIPGVDMTLRNPPDLILCDITVPLFEGYAVLLELADHAATAQIPYMFIAPKASHEGIRRGMALGADDYLIKPFTRGELLQAVQTRLEKTATQMRQHQRQVEQLQRALEQERAQRMLKAKTVALFSHDIRNPLAIILMTNGLLRHLGNRFDEERRQTYMERIDAAGRQLVQMLDDLLVVAQMEAGQLDFDPELLHITQFVRQIAEEFQAIHGKAYRLLLDSLPCIREAGRAGNSRHGGVDWLSRTWRQPAPSARPTPGGCDTSKPVEAHDLRPSTC